MDQINGNILPNNITSLNSELKNGEMLPVSNNLIQSSKGEKIKFKTFLSLRKKLFKIHQNPICNL